MGCASSSQAAGVSSPSPTLLTGSQSGKNLKFAPGQSAIIRDCPNARLNGSQVICESYNASLGEWQVKGDVFPLTVGMSIGEKFLEPTAQAQFSGMPQQAPSIPTGDSPLGTVLEMYLPMFDGRFDGSNEKVCEYVSSVWTHAQGIIQQGSGLGASGECPFVSAYEVHLFYQFCLKVCIAWSEHKMGKDERMDQDFLSQMSDLCEILCFLDTDAVPLPEEIAQNIKMIQRDALFPHWVEAQTAKNDAMALECCVAVGKKWGLEETAAFQRALNTCIEYKEAYA